MPATWPTWARRSWAPPSTASRLSSARSGIHLFPVYSAGKLLWYQHGKLTPYTGTIPPVADTTALGQIAVAMNDHRPAGRHGAPRGALEGPGRQRPGQHDRRDMERAEPEPPRCPCPAGAHRAGRPVGRAPRRLVAVLPRLRARRGRHQPPGRQRGRRRSAGLPRPRRDAGHRDRGRAGAARPRIAQPAGHPHRPDPRRRDRPHRRPRGERQAGDRRHPAQPGRTHPLRAGPDRAAHAAHPAHAGRLADQDDRRL